MVQSTLLMYGRSEIDPHLRVTGLFINICQELILSLMTEYSFYSFYRYLKDCLELDLLNVSPSVLVLIATWFKHD